MSNVTETITEQKVLRHSYHTTSAVTLAAVTVPVLHFGAAFAAPSLHLVPKFEDFGTAEAVTLLDVVALLAAAVAGGWHLAFPHKTLVHEIGTSQKPAPPVPPAEKIDRTRWI